MRIIPTQAAPLLLSLVLLLAATASPAEAQPRFEVSGVVTDSTDTGLSGATVVVLQESDSTLVSFGITRHDGAFRIERVPAGRHILQVSFVGYTPHSQSIAVTDASLDFGRIVLREAVAELGELVVRADHVPMIVNRDTLEYNAAAFRVPPNANVEELLKRLPGIEVERDGTIRAQGEEVRQVLVDGREFFGNDPTVATRNLPAEAVDRVQVYDRRSDRAEFTGVDDGEEERTINLALRPERRQGYFGNASAGLGDLRRYEGRAMVNRFSSGTQASVITNVNNINQQGFSTQDYMRFMGGAQAMMAEGGQISFGGAPINTGLSSGFATTLSGGINFNHEFGSRTSLRSSYIGYYLNHEQDRQLLQHELAGAAASALSEQQTTQESSQLNHRLNLNLLHTFSEGHDIRLRSNFQMSDSELQSWTDRETMAGGDVQNATETSYATSSETLGGDASLTYRRRFAPGRTITAELRSSLNDGEDAGDLAAVNQLYRDGDVLTTEEINQLQSQLNTTLTHRQRISYTEPLGRRELLQFDVEHRVVAEDRTRDVFDLLGGTPAYDHELSSAFERTYRYYRAGVDFRRSLDPLTVRFGVSVQRADLDGSIRGADDAVAGSFVRVLPSATVGYSFSRTRNLELRYTTSTREPSMRDLQPFVDNSDPLNVYVGNPNLLPEYSHNATLRFMLFDPFTSTNLFAFVRAGYTLDRIVRSRTIDEHLRQTVTMVNADRDWSISGNVSFGTPIRPLGIRANISTHTLFNRGTEFVNGDANMTEILRSTWELRLENRNKDVVDAQIGARYSFNDVSYRLNPALDRSYVNRTFFGEVGLQLFESWRVRTMMDYHLYADGVFGGTAEQVPLFHAEVSRQVMNNRAEVKLEVRDLLNRNVGVNYTNTPTFIQEERVASLGRYVMLRFVYNLSATGRPTGSTVVQTIGG